ncbi:TPA: hypothetical protein QC183_005754 [Bacillus cereus]|nr:hypothetical protein [Bacillus cereus]HDR8337501.1 hypothetical protein [Bacillus cereus]
MINSLGGIMIRIFRKMIGNVSYMVLKVKSIFLGGLVLKYRCAGKVSVLPATILEVREM